VFSISDTFGADIRHAIKGDLVESHQSAAAHRAASLFDLTGRLALVTGSSRGIGRTLAQGLADAGAAVILHGRGGAALEESARVLSAAGAGLSVRDAALAEPLAVALHAINVAGGVDGARVLVSGSGPIGLLVAAGALASGAEWVACSDVLTGPLARARDLGVQATYRVGVDEIPDEAFDVVFECSGVPAAVSSSIRAVRRAGVIAQVGMMSAGPKPIELATLISKEAQLRGCFRFRDEIDAALDLLARDPGIARVVTHEVPADDVHAAFATARDSEASGKVLVRLWRAES
jgi:L-idonate 5-dehydrogenase